MARGWATGQVWLAAQATQLGLVDQVATQTEALARAQQESGMGVWARMFGGLRAAERQQAEAALRSAEPMDDDEDELEEPSDSEPAPTEDETPPDPSEPPLEEEEEEAECGKEPKTAARLVPQLSAQLERARAEERAAKAELDRIRYEERAQVYASLPTERATLVTALRAIDAIPQPQRKAVVAVLDACRRSMDAVLSEAGTRGASVSGATAYEQIEQRAQQLLRREQGLTMAQAIDRTIQARPDLWRAHREEMAR